MAAEAKDSFSATCGAHGSKLVSEVVLGEADCLTIHLDCIDGCGHVVSQHQEVDPVNKRCCSFHGAEVNVRCSSLCSLAYHYFWRFLVFKHGGNVFGGPQARVQFVI
jgi:hypothetical protein